jgi:hypothetical protein
LGLTPEEAVDKIASGFEPEPSVQTLAARCSVG